MDRHSLYASLAVALLGMSSTAGCRYGGGACVDHVVSRVSCPPMDALAPASAGETSGDERPELVPQPSPQVSAGGTKKRQLLEIPKDLPGSSAPPIQVPPLRRGETPEERGSEIEKLYEPLPPLEAAAGPQSEPGQAPLTLEELQQMALSRSPVLRQAAADVESARGNAIQAGLRPNPHVGYQADTINTGRTGGYQGVGLTQTIPTGGKLRLARAAAQVDADNAQWMLLRTRYDVATQVRSSYFAALAALERVKVNRALSVFADRIYRAQVARVPAGQSAAYEPLQVRVPALQAQSQLVQSQNDYLAAWRRLAAALNCPEMPPTTLAGRIDSPVPSISYEVARERILRVHPDLVVARNSVTRARYNLDRARIAPVVPDLDLSTAVQHDFTTPQQPTAVSLQLLAPVPIFDNNRGNILAAEAAVARACSECDRVRNELVSNLADAFARYQTARQTVEYYRGGILGDQVRVYRGVYQRYEAQEGADFSDVVTAQQTLANAIATYLQNLGDQWQAVVDLAGLMQVDDLFLVGSDS